MAYIYYIMRNKSTLKGCYIGQDTHDLLDYGNSRIAEHARIAYGLHNGKFYGSEELMRQNSLSGLWYKVYDNESDCFGVGMQSFQEFKKYWTHSNPNTLQEKIDFAEMCHILINSLNPTISTYNIGIGGQNTWTFNNSMLETYAAQVDALQRKKSGVSYVNLLKKYPELNKLTIHFPDGIKDGIKVFEPEGYQIVRLIAKAITEECLLDSQSWQLFLITNIINLINTINVKNETANVALFQEKVKKYLDEKVHKEILDWNRVVKINFSFKIKMDFTQDASRIAKMLAKRIKHIGDYGGQIIQYMLYGGDNRKKSKIANTSLSKADQQTLRITRAAYIEDVRWTPPSSIDKSPFNKWYVSAIGALKGSYYRNIKDPGVSFLLKKVSYEAFKKWVSHSAESVSPYRLAGTLYEDKAGRGFYQGGVAEEVLYNEDVPFYYDFNRVQNTLRWKVRQQVEKTNIHGELLHFWDNYYRQMATIWLKDVHRTKLEKQDEKDEQGRPLYYSEHTGQTYSFLDQTWQEIQEYQEKSLKDVWVY